MSSKTKTYRIFFEDRNYEVEEKDGRVTRWRKEEYLGKVYIWTEWTRWKPKHHVAEDFTSLLTPENEVIKQVKKSNRWTDLLEELED